MAIWIASFKGDVEGKRHARDLARAAGVEEKDIERAVSEEHILGVDGTQQTVLVVREPKAKEAPNA